MSNFQFVIKGIGRKIDGKVYKDGDVFPYEPGNPAHKRLLDLNIIAVVAVEPTKKVNKPARRTAKK